MDEVLELFRLETPAWQMVLRGSAIYGFLLIIFRFLLRRDVGTLGRGTTGPSATDWCCSRP